MRTSTASWPAPASPSRTASADASETSCSLERPPRQHGDLHGVASGVVVCGVVRRRLVGRLEVADHDDHRRALVHVLAGRGPLLEHLAVVALGRWWCAGARSRPAPRRAARGARRPGPGPVTLGTSVCCSPRETTIVTSSPRCGAGAAGRALADDLVLGRVGVAQLHVHLQPRARQPRLGRLPGQADHVGHLDPWPGRS